MPSIMDVVEIAEALGTKSVFPVKDRCIAVRNRHSSCHKCSEACPAGAIYAEKNKLEFDAALCMNCGSCTTVCPVEALVSLLPDDETLRKAINLTMPEADGAAVFACARIASKGLADPVKYAEVPCLSRMEESMLLELAAQGVTEIVLVDGTCKTCKYRSCRKLIREVVDTANVLLETQGSDVRVKRMSEFPDCASVHNRQELLAESRRGFFTSMHVRANDAAVETVKHMAGKGEPKNKVQEKLRDLIKVTEKGSLPQFNPERRGRLLDAMFELGESAPVELHTRLFGTVEIDYEKCNACGMCTVFCPTGALVKSQAKPEGEGFEGCSYLEFSASDCVQCNLCADACLQKCLTVHPYASTEDLFDFEPRMILLPPKPKRQGWGKDTNRFKKATGGKP